MVSIIDMYPSPGYAASRTTETAKRHKIARIACACARTTERVALLVTCIQRYGVRETPTPWTERRPSHHMLQTLFENNANMTICIADRREFIKISQAVGMGFLIMGAIGYFIKLSKSTFLVSSLSHNVPLSGQRFAGPLESAIRMD